MTSDRTPWKADLAPYARANVPRALLDLATSLVPYLALMVLQIAMLRSGTSFWVVLPLAVPTAGFLLRTYIVFHDCTHGSFLPTKRGNHILGAAVGVIVFTPFQTWRHSHAMHHATAGDLDRRGQGDVPTMTVDEYLAHDWPMRAGYRAFRNPLVMFGLGWLWGLVIQPRMVGANARARLKRSTWVTNVVLALLITGICFWVGPINYLLAQAPAAALAGSAGVFLFYVQHQFEDTYWENTTTWSYADAALRGSSYLKLPQPFQFFTGNIGLHHVHHLSARVPNYSLQAAVDNVRLFDDVPVLSFWDGVKASRLKVWSPEHGRLLTWAEVRALRRAVPAAAATRSWVAGADEAGFGTTNLPYGVVRRPGEPPRPVVRIGGYVLELRHAFDWEAAGAPSLNAFLGMGAQAWAEARRHLVALLADRAASEPLLVPLSTVETLLPVEPGDYVDFYASLEHATNVGKRFRAGGSDPLPPAWRHLPIGYHGRSGSVVVSGTPVPRPSGLRGPGDFGPERELDYELELGIVCGDRDPFGVVLLNDWSAREIQRFEYVPLGPFNGKSFATSISPWVVPLEALPMVEPTPQDPAPADYLRHDGAWALDVDLEVEVNGEVVTKVNARELYWTVDQLVAHTVVGGAELRAGDLLGTGTISAPGQPGCRLETGGPYLRDGDEVVMRGRAGDVSLGEVHGVVTPPGDDSVTLTS